MNRSRKTEMAYMKYRIENRGKDCVFCEFNDANASQVIRTTSHFWIVKNIFPYKTWDMLPVKHHLMIVPKRHVDSLSHFTAPEMKEYTELLVEYDTAGYSAYGRASGNIAKSIAHQHTHLLKLGTRPRRVGFYLLKPYINLQR